MARFATHPNPVRRPVPSFMLRARLDDIEGDENFEQIWSKRLDDDLFEVCCADRAGEPLSLDDLVGRSVASASAKEGTLVIVFADGATLRCEPDADYEAWQVEGGHPLRLVVCRAGGELSVWDGTPPIPYGQLRERDPLTAAALDKLLKAYNLPPPVGYPPPEKGPSPFSPWRKRG